MRMPRRRLLTTVLLVSGGALFLWLLVVRGGLTSNELEQSRHLASEHILHTSSSQSQHQQVCSLSLEILYEQSIEFIWWEGLDFLKSFI